MVRIFSGHLQALPPHSSHVVDREELSPGGDGLDDLLGVGNDEEAAVVLVHLLDLGVMPQRALVLHRVHYPLRYPYSLAAVLHREQ